MIFYVIKVLRMPAHAKSIRCMALHPEEDRLGTAAFDKVLKIWE